MRPISQSELSAISGGMNCIDYPTWEKINQKAMKDGFNLAALGTPIIAAITYGLTQSFSTTISTAVTVAPYIAGFGYFKSSAWSIFE